jgi:Cu+-exporting ATPase
MMNKNENADRNGAPKAACCGGHSHDGHDHTSHGHQAHTAATVRDPVCGMTVDPATSKHRFDYHGETLHFCSASCRTKFAADPAS